MDELSLFKSLEDWRYRQRERERRSWETMIMQNSIIVKSSFNHVYRGVFTDRWKLDSDLTVPYDGVDLQLKDPHIVSKEGDWIYPRDEGFRSNDFLEDCPDTDPNEMDNKMLLAVWLVKMKIRCYNSIRPELWVHFIYLHEVGSVLGRWS